MQIENITNFLQKDKNREFLSTLQANPNLNINQIQRLIQDNPDKPIRDLLSQIELQRHISWKVNSADQFIFTRKGAEQCSSSEVAAYHGSKFSHFKIVADLCCGVGLDLMHLASHKARVYAIDNDKETLLAASYNCEITGLKNIIFRWERAEEFNEFAEAVFIDPDRRNEGRRSVKAEEYSPNWQQILKLNMRYPDMAVKLSPLFDFRNADLPENSTLEFVSELGTLKEVLLCLGKLSTPGVIRKAVLLPSGIILGNDRSNGSEFSPIKEYIYEPDPAIIRGGLVKELARKINYQMIDRRSALLTSTNPAREDFGRLYKVDTILPYSFRKLQKFIKNNNIGQLIIKTRGLSESVESLRKRLKLRGSGKALILIVKLGDQHKMLKLSKAPN
jgi:hypothetical protein